MPIPQIGDTVIPNANFRACHTRLKPYPNLTGIVRAVNPNGNHCAVEWIDVGPLWNIRGNYGYPTNTDAIGFGYLEIIPAPFLARIRHKARTIEIFI